MLSVVDEASTQSLHCEHLDGQKAEAKTLDFNGGRYAVTRCQGVENIPHTWQSLVHWLADSSHQPGSHQWLEEHLDPVDAPPEEWCFDLYAPIAA